MTYDFRGAPSYTYRVFDLDGNDITWRTVKADDHEGVAHCYQVFDEPDTREGCACKIEFEGKTWFLHRNERQQDGRGGEIEVPGFQVEKVEISAVLWVSKG